MTVTSQARPGGLTNLNKQKFVQASVMTFRLRRVTLVNNVNKQRNKCVYTINVSPETVCGSDALRNSCM